MFLSKLSRGLEEGEEKIGGKDDDDSRGYPDSIYPL